MIKIYNNITCNHNAFINHKILQAFRTLLIPSEIGDKQGYLISVLFSEEVDVLEDVLQQENEMRGLKIKKWTN